MREGFAPIPFPGRPAARNGGRSPPQAARSLANHPLSAYTPPIRLNSRLRIFPSAAFIRRHENNKKGGGFPFPFFSPSWRATRCGLGGHSPGDGFFSGDGTCREDAKTVDKDSREALQVAKELTAKFIETRTVSPGNFAEIFPAVYGVVVRAIAQYAPRAGGAPRDAGDGE